ncbi:MAG: hypothetical protein JSS36_09395 [Proteobacteria bacterium]|nr:hypothetical protein [Pseudomonadota bacterium]
MSLPRLWPVAVLTLALGACAEPMGELPPSLESVRVLRNQAVPPLAIGRFVSGDKAIGRTITVRLGVLHAPKGKDFASFLGATFETELRAAGKLDPAAPLRIDGTLTESRIDEDFRKGGGVLGARITLLRQGVPVFSKAYQVETHWDSSLIGAIAIEQAFNDYNGLYAQLARKVFADPDFVAAAKQ